MSRKRYVRRSVDTFTSSDYRLSKIEEDPKEDEDVHLYKQSSTVRYTPKSRTSLPPLMPTDSKTQFVFDFLIKLAGYPQVYKQLTTQAKTRKILKAVRPMVFVSTPKKTKFPSLLQTPTHIQEPSINTSLIQEEVARPLTIDIKLAEPKRQNSKESITTTPLVIQKQVTIKLPVLEKGSSKLFDQFRTIAGGTDTSHKDYKLNYDSFKEFLSQRYPIEMVEVMLKWLYHGLSVNFEGWVQDMQKFINLSNEKHSRIAFELYDFNKDRYLCTADAFRVISVQNSMIFSQDIIKIRQAFLQKASNDPNSARLSARKKKASKNKAFMSAEDEVKYKVPTTHPSKPEAITLEDFMRVQFHLNKPQIIIDIIKYLTGIDLIEFNTETLKVVKRKRSEEIIEDMVLSGTKREKAASESRMIYYKELETAMAQFKLPQCKSLLSKFAEMSFDGPSNLKEVNFKTIVEVMPKYLGTDNVYLLQSFHNILSGPRNLNITKISYLNSLNVLFSEETSNQFAFGLYDQNQDGFITCEEIHLFFESLSENTLIYKECLILINEFIASIFGKRHKELDGIDYPMFKDLIPKSILIDVIPTQEFIKSLTSADPYKNLSFADKSELTPAELESFKKYSHLQRNIELGDDSRHTDEDSSPNIQSE